MINKQSYQIQGMRQDNLVGTGYSNKFAHEIINMRFNTIGDYTTASWTTEKGTKKVVVQPMDIEGTGDAYNWLSFEEVANFQPIGQANINDEWILFGVLNSYSVILNLHYKGDILQGRLLYKGDATGDLGFDVEHPIETLTFYENELLQKVYWTDGKNQPRVINIKGAEGLVDGYPNIPTQFDFTQEVSLNETVEITKDQSGAGLFPPGTVKYALSYYHKYGQETNIVYDSPLYYPTLGERACSPDELSGDSFYIKVTNLDLTHGFDYIRLYSIVRTTDGAEPIVRIVADKLIKDITPDDNGVISVTFHDTNTTGRIIDSSIIQFIGGREIIAHTFDQKNNTLFLGNIEIKTKSVTKILQEAEVMDSITANAQANNTHFHFDNNVREALGIRKVSNDWSVYQWISQLNQTPVYNQGTGEYKPRSANSQYTKHFKFRETYRFGVQFQDSKGAWSEVLYLNDLTNNVKPYTDEWNMECLFAGAKYTLPYQAVNVLYNNGYKKARLVCCYPTNADRLVVAQGVVAPTVYNNDWRESHTPDAMSSWFFRPNDRNVTGKDNFKVSVLPWRDNQALDEAYFVSGNNKNTFYLVPEVQSTYHYNTTADDRNTPLDVHGNKPWNEDKSVYKVCRKILTFHSPEIEYDESLRTMPSDNWEVVVIGRVPINSFAAKYYLEADTPAVVYSGDRGNGFSKGMENRVVHWYNGAYDGTLDGTHMTALGEWDDANLYTTTSKMKEWLPFCIYPFHRKGSLNNYIRDISEWKIDKYNEHDAVGEFDIRQSAVLHNKCLSHILYSTTALFEDSEVKILDKTDNPENAVFSIFDSNEVLPLKLKTNKITGSDVYTGEDFIYYGNVNNISPISDYPLEYWLNGYDDENHINIEGSYPIGYYAERTSGKIKFDFTGVNTSDEGSNAEGVFVSDPVPITYKSTAHGVFFSSNFGNGINFTNITRSVPRDGGEPGTPLTPTAIEIVTQPLTSMPFLYLAEVRRKVDENTRFGGKPTLANPIDNVYVPCGPAVNLVQGSDIVLNGLEGDTYYMRYDNLKTYPFATDDTNQIVEILSFMVETRINLDGRYDKNRGLLDNTMITNTNFGLINKSYTQTNNTFTFMTLDQMSAELNNFANQITWTKEKVNGEETDAWTNITLASTADADGTLGNITKILNLNDKLLLFQDHGLAQINYNENTAISTENGIPLELSKTGKFTGLDYFTREIGCQNKWSISKSKNGLFWIDDSRQELLIYAEGIKSLSTANGFDAFMIKSLPSTFEKWNPRDFNNFVTYYDKLSNDIYYINKDNCLAWNEQTGTFTSFYNYERVPYMVNVGQHSLMWNNGVWAARELTELDANNVTKEVYSKFFGNVKDYSITLVCDGITDKGSAFPVDKVFNNIEYRADIYNLDGNNTNYKESVFNIKQAWNGYQDSQEVLLDGERKFNTWRVQLPRHHGTRDRIRNPFCYIKLKQDQLLNAQTNRIILHDLAVYFDMR